MLFVTACHLSCVTELSGLLHTGNFGGGVLPVKCQVVGAVGRGGTKGKGIYRNLWWNSPHSVGQLLPVVGFDSLLFR